MLPQGRVQFRLKCRRDFTLTPIFAVESDRFSDCVHDDLARIAASEVLLELFANGGIDIAINVIVQLPQ